jgi:hypothetical protein
VDTPFAAPTETGAHVPLAPGSTVFDPGRERQGWTLPQLSSDGSWVQWTAGPSGVPIGPKAGSPMPVRTRSRL